MKNNYIKSIVFVLVFQTIAHCSYGQDSKPLSDKGFKIEMYPSVSLMYGLLFYETESGNKNSITNKHYNENYNIGIQFNTDITLKGDFRLQLYGGYSRWNQANLFPIGILIKPKLNKKTNELFLKLGGGFSFGKRYDDQNERWIASSMPRDYGNGNIHGLLGIEKNFHWAEKKSISVGFMLNLQLIKSYTTEISYNAESRLYPYFIPYKFAGLTIAYHFY